MLRKPFRESEQTSLAGRNRSGGSQVHLYRPNLPEGCIDIPDQCIGFFVTGACREKFWGELIRYSSPTRYREIFWGNIICINCVDNGSHPLARALGWRSCALPLVHQWTFASRRHPLVHDPHHQSPAWFWNAAAEALRLRGRSMTKTRRCKGQQKFVLQ